MGRHSKMLGPAVKIFCLVAVLSFSVSEGEAKGVNWGPMLESLTEDGNRLQSIAGLSKVQTLIGRMQSLMQQLDAIYDAEGMNTALTKNYDKPSVRVRMDGLSK